MWSGRTYWLIGASEGVGRALAKELDRFGARLVLSARSGARLEELAEELSGDARALPFDVTDAASVAAAWEKLGEAAGEIDGVVYLAGGYEPMTVRDWDAEKALAICEVNFMGAMRVMGHVAPAFLKRGSGHIALIGSLAGYRGLPGAIGYGASKAALMHLAENLHAELWRSGVRVQLMNPGFVRTRLTDKNSFRMPFLMTPEEAARILREAMERGAFKRDFPWGFSLVFRLSRLLPAPLYNRIFARG